MQTSGGSKTVVIQTTAQEEVKCCFCFNMKCGLIWIIVILYATILNILITALVGAGIAFVADTGSSIAEASKNSQFTYDNGQ